MSRKLSVDDIIETTGVSDPDELGRLTELEILFLSFDEISSLHRCSALRRLAFIDNGIKKLSNLNVLGPTLTSLCICDQEIRVVENLNLPNLRELFLHRNLITSITCLAQCPRIKKLWLFQNKLTTIDQMAATPELEELFLQGNSISSLDGLLGCNSLRMLSLAGNPISSINDVLLLENLRGLKALSFSDIHFGKCPVSDLEGFNNLILSKFKNLNKLDGVDIKGDAVSHANEEMENQLRIYNEEMQAIEDEYRREIQILENSHSSKESHLHLLEKEMAAAVKELNDVVSDGRQTMAKQLKFQESLIEKNLSVLKEKIDASTLETKSLLLNEICECERLMYSQSHILSVLEQLYTCDLSITSALGDVCKASLKPEAAGSSAGYCIGYQSINHNNADFQMLSKLVGYNANSSNPNPNLLTNEISIELAKLYRILCNNRNGSSTSGGNIPVRDITIQGLSAKKLGYLADETGGGASNAHYSSILNNERVFIVLSFKQLKAFLAGGWAALCDDLGGGEGGGVPVASVVDQKTKPAAKPANTDLALSASQDDYLYDSFEESSPIKSARSTLPNSISNTINSSNGNNSNIINNNNNNHNSNSTSNNNNDSNKKNDCNSLLLSTNAPLLLSLLDLKSGDLSVSHGSGDCTLEALAGPADAIMASSKREKDILDYIIADSDTVLAKSATMRDASLSSLLIKRTDDPFVQKFYVLLSCIVDMKSLNSACDIKDNSWDVSAGPKTNPQNIFPMPHDDALRNELRAKLTSHTSATHSRIRGNSNGTDSTPTTGKGSSGEVIYSLPLRSIDQIARKSTIKPEYIGLALVSQQLISQKSSGSSVVLPTLRIMENVLEHISLPNFEMEKSSFIMKNYEDTLVSETRYYLDKLMEEVNESEAAVLQQSNDHIVAKEAALRRLKEDVEKERRLQESLLRDIKYQSSNPNSNLLPSAAGSGGGSGASNAQAPHNASRRR